MASYQTPGRDTSNPIIKWLLVAIVGFLLLLVVFAGVATTYYKNALKPVGGSSNQVFVVEEGASPGQIASSLEEAGIIKDSLVFQWYLKLHNADSLKAGTYHLNTSMNVSEIVSVLSDGKVAEDLVTILPGKRIETIKKELIESGYAQADVERALNPSLYGSHPVFTGFTLPDTLEGFLYPDTYSRTQIDMPEEVIRLSLDEMAAALSPEVRAGIAAQGLSLYDGLKLASIVEKEVSAANPDDRPRAAQVFLKRLKIGMKLQSNATDNLPDEFDTYTIAGLPPEPISNVSVSSLKAVANPSGTDYLYFVSGKDCVTRFSATNAEHEALKSQYGIATPEDSCR